MNLRYETCSVSREIAEVTTLALDDEVYQLARVAAAAEGKTVDEFVGRVLRDALAPPRMQQSVRNGLPVMVPGSPVPLIDPEKVRSQLEEDGF